MCVRICTCIQTFSYSHSLRSCVCADMRVLFLGLICAAGASGPAFDEIEDLFAETWNTYRDWCISVPTLKRSIANIRDPDYQWLTMQMNSSIRNVLVVYSELEEPVQSLHVLRVSPAVADAHFSKLLHSFVSQSMSLLCATSELTAEILQDPQITKSTRKSALYNHLVALTNKSKALLHRWEATRANLPQLV